jgi:hypothetical protein
VRERVAAEEAIDRLTGLHQEHCLAGVSKACCSCTPPRKSR